jgi:hypothetical protein
VGIRRDRDDGTTLRAFISKWSGEAETLRRLGAHVDGAKLIDALLIDLHALTRAEASESLTLEEAARESGYTSDHLGKLLRSGTIPNAGRKNAPRILRSHLPLKPSALRETRRDGQLAGATPGQIARAVVTSSGDLR